MRFLFFTAFITIGPVSGTPPTFKRMSQEEMDRITEKLAAARKALETKSISLKRSADSMELHIGNADCLLKVTLTRDEANTLLQMHRNNQLGGFTFIKPCIDPKGDGLDKGISNSYYTPKSYVGDASSAIYTGKGMECFHSDPPKRIGEYVYRGKDSEEHDPSMYTGGQWGKVLDLVGLRTHRVEIEVEDRSDGSTPQSTPIGVLARKYCFVVGNRAFQVRRLIAQHRGHTSDDDSNGASEAPVSVLVPVPASGPASSERYSWSDDLDDGIKGDSEVTKGIWKHTQEMLNNKKLESGWEISSAADSAEVTEKTYVLKPIDYTQDSTIFGTIVLVDPTFRVYKYTNNCSTIIIHCRGRNPCELPKEDLRDPLVDEFLIMNILGDSHSGYVAPIPYAYAISKKTPVSKDINDFANVAKTKSMTIQKTGYPGLKQCANNLGTFRGIEEDYVGIDISNHFASLLEAKVDEKTFMIEVIAVTRRMVGLMWRFHDLGFIHGDFHGGNGAFKERKADVSSYLALKDEMVLIDFGLSEFIPKEYGKDENKTRRETLEPVFLSPWHLGGYRIGRRDDLYRVLETTASLLVKFYYTREIRINSEAGREYDSL